MPPKKVKTNPVNTTTTSTISQINEVINTQQPLNNENSNNQNEDNTSVDNHISVNSSELERRNEDKDDKDSEVSSIGKKSETEIKSDIKLAKSKRVKKIDIYDKKLHSNIETIIFEEKEEENDDIEFSTEKLKLGKSQSVRESI